MKCNNCIYAHVIISENGKHCVCSLSDKKAMDCISQKKEHKEKRKS